MLSLLNFYRHEDLNDGQNFVAMWWQWSFILIFFGHTLPSLLMLLFAHKEPTFQKGASLTIVDNVFDVMVFMSFGWLSWFFKIFSWLLVGFYVFFQGIFMVFHFLQFTITFAIFFVRPSGQMFLRFIGHCMGLFLMVDKHQSSNVMFAMYRSSL